MAVLEIPSVCSNCSRYLCIVTFSVSYQKIKKSSRTWNSEPTNLSSFFNEVFFSLEYKIVPGGKLYLNHSKQHNIPVHANFMCVYIYIYIYLYMYIYVYAYVHLLFPFAVWLIDFIRFDIISVEKIETYLIRADEIL